MCILIIDQLFLSQQPSPFVSYNHGGHLACRKNSILGIGIPKIRQVSMLIMILYIGNLFMSYQCIIL